MQPPEIFVKQLQVYEDAAAEDAHELKERIQEITLEEGNPAYAISELLKKIDQQSPHYQALCSMLRYMVSISKSVSSASSSNPYVFVFVWFDTW